MAKAVKISDVKKGDQIMIEKIMNSFEEVVKVEGNNIHFKGDLAIDPTVSGKKIKKKG